MSPASRRRAATLFAFLVAFAAIGTRPAPAAAAELTIAEAELTEVRLLNAERAKAGLVPVRVDSRLMSLARSRSADMLAKNYFGQVQPDGRDVFDLLSAAEIKWYRAGELIARNSVSTLASSAETARDGWMGSPGHRAVLMSPDFNYVGVGLAVDWATGKKMWTAVFLKGPDRTGAWAKLDSVTTSSPTASYQAVTLHWTGDDVRLSVLTAGFSHYQTQIRVDSDPWRWSSKSATSVSKTFKAWITHTYDFRVRACDKAGNCGNWSTVHDIRYAPTPTPTPSDAVVLGAYVKGFPSSSTALDAFNTLVERPARIVMYYQNWTGEWNDFCTSCADTAHARGGMPLITWEPWVSAKSIAAGEQDAYLRSYLRAVAAWGKPIYIRPMHEMNGGWYPWGYGVNGNTAADLQNAFRRIVTIGRSEGATNVRWVWSPNVGQFDRVSYAAIYPGDAYVDWLGLDGYNWGTSQSWSGWQSLRAVMKGSYDAITALSTRPLMIGETASSELGGDKGAWIRQGFLTDLPSVMPRVRAVVWFHENKETDWRTNSTSSALAAYREVAASARYQGRLP